jgi:acetone carboxylase gamma subunit
MSCPTCDHTMSRLGVIDGRPHYHCPRCGTHRIDCGSDGAGPITHDFVPKLVARCRKFEGTLGPRWGELWVALGIAESINTPGNRPS